MSAYLFKISRYISIVAVIFSFIATPETGYESRQLMLLTSFVLFLITSYVYEKKWGIFGPSYAIYFIVLFLIHNVSPYNYIFRYQSYNTLISNPLARIPTDNYKIYFMVFIFCSLIIIGQLLLSKKKINEQIKFVRLLNLKEAKIILITTIVMLVPLAILVGGIFKTILIPATSYYLISFIFIKETRKYWTFKIGLIASVLIIATQIISRYIMVRYLMPIGLAIILFDYIKSGFYSKTTFKKKALVINSIVIVMLYGVYSEIIKLSRLKSISTSPDVFLEVFSSVDVLLKWIDRQMYRIFEIWTILGGNVIDYVNTNGYFYGLTYIKFLSQIIGFDYISLPSLSASFVGANYAQPGLIAEGYANFGIIGAMVNFLCVYYLAEIFQTRFFFRPTMFNILLIVTPFSSVILDGGTFNAVMFNIVFLLLTFILSKLKIGKRNTAIIRKNPKAVSIGD